jgi:hypothetical protein
VLLAGAEGGQPITQRGAEYAAQIGAEAALNAGLHHVQSPQQQCDRAGKIEQGPHGRLPHPAEIWISDQ